ncbi:MAG: DUF2628 domain-containing protein [Magnetospirillum sp. WYHS-4]
MQLFTVHLEPRAGTLAVIKEGFSWPAFLFLPAWALWHGMWATGVAIATLIAAITLVPVGLDGQALLSLGLAALLGSVANDLLRHMLERRGWRFAAVVAGRNREAAEFRFLDQHPELFR